MVAQSLAQLWCHLLGAGSILVVGLMWPQLVGLTQPLDKLLLVGDDLRVNCTLLGHLAATSHNITFILVEPNHVHSNPRCLPSSMVTRIDATTATLTVHNVTPADAGRYACQAGGAGCGSALNYSNPGSEQVLLDVRVEYPPQNVTNFTCVVYNWESLTCTWQHGVSYLDKSRIEVTSTYTTDAFSRPGVFYPCPVASFTGCRWDKVSFRGFSRYVVEVKVTNLDTFRATSKQFVQDTERIIKPAPVYQLRSVFRTECFFLSWLHLKIYRPKVYRVKHQVVGETAVGILADNLTHAHFSACGYRPYTHHRFYVDAHPSLVWSGYWSQPVSTDGWTPMAAPEAGPVTTNGSFTTTDCKDGHRGVTLMWKEVDKWKQNGIIDSYMITSQDVWVHVQPHVQPHAQAHVQPHVQANGSSAVVKLPCFVTSRVHLAAHNKKGFSQRPSVLVIPPVHVSVSEKVKASFAVEVTSHPNTSWISRSVGAIWDAGVGTLDTVGYKVFWCLGLPGQACQSEVTWVDVSRNQTRTEIPISALDSPRYLFGISAFDVQSQQASGIFWTDCLFTRYPTHLPAVEGMRVEAGVESAWVVWSPLRCTYLSKVRVTGYRVQWRQQANPKDPAFTAVVNATQFFYQVLGLAANVAHVFSVQALSGESVGDEVEPWRPAVPTLPDRPVAAWVVIPLVISSLVTFCVFYLYRQFRRRGRFFESFNIRLVNWPPDYLQYSNTNS